MKRHHRQFITLCLVFALLGSLVVIPSIPGAQAQSKLKQPADSPLSGDATAGQDKPLSDSARLQIESLIEEKQGRSEVQRKLDSQLVYAAKQERGEPISSLVDTLELNVVVGKGGLTLVDIRADVTGDVLSAIRRVGGEVVSSFPQYRSIRAYVPVDALESVSAQQGLQFIRPADQPLFHGREAQAKTTGATPGALSGQPTTHTANSTQSHALLPGFDVRAATVRQKLTTALSGKGSSTDALQDEPSFNIGSANSQGDRTHNADQARNFYGLNGKGIKIGIISDSFNLLGGYNNDIASGDLPGPGNPNLYTTPVTVIQEAAAGGGNDEGRAMAQIVHDVVPGAQLYFATANGGVANFAANITNLRNAGCDIIVDDVSYFTESPFQNDAIGNAVDAVVTGGGMYFSSVGNEGNLNDNTSGTWEGDYVDSGTLTVGTSGTLQHVHDFDPTAAVAKFNQIVAGSGQPIVLFWSDPLGASNNDYDLYILNNAGTAVSAASTSDQTGTQDPFEGTSGGNVTGRRIVIDKFSGVSRYMHLDTTGAIVNFKTSGQARGHAATSNGYAVAATPAVGPFPASFSSSNQVETFSSDGLRRVFYAPNGTPLTPGNVSSTGGVVKQKPEITAADGVSTTVSALFNPFFGTSAASPHAAAIAGLIKSSNTSLTSTQILNAMTTTAIDIEAPGVDRDSGFGIVMPVPALQNLGAAPGATIALGTASVTPVGGCDAVFNSGETGALTVQLSNVGGAGATGISATVTSTTPGVTVTQSTSPYPDIPASGTANNSRPFTFTLPSNFICGSSLRFTVTVTFAGGQASPVVLNVTVPTGTTTAGSATTTSYTGPTVAIPDTNPGSVNIPLSVSGFSGAVSDLNFKIGGTSCNATTGATTNGINHTWVGDLSVTLTSPQGTSVTMINRAGGINNSGNNFCNTVLDDSAANSIQTVTIAQNPYTGTFKPANPLSAFNGENPNGTWTLTVTDAESPDSGNVTAFSLDITPFVCPAAPTSTITGRITDASNNGIDAVTVKLSGTESQTTSTNANGDYTFNLATCGGTYTVTPSKPGYTFSPPERTFVNLSGNQTANFTGSTGITPTTLSPGQVVISEFRARGLAGALDEFVEIANKTGSPITVGSSDATTAGWTLAALDTSGTSSTTIYTIPNGTVIPAYGHFLIANGGGYSLNSYATADAYFTGDIPDNTGLALFTTGNNAGPTFDAVGFNTAPPGFADLYREGGGTTPVGTTNGQYSLYRTLPTGLPQDTNNNANDFEFVSTNAGTYGSRVSKLGAPGPENLNSPTVHTGIIPGYQIDTTKASTVAPNRVRDLAPYIDSLTPTTVGGTYTLGTLSFRRRYVNATGAPVKQLRFRLIDYTSFPAAPGMADLRALTSPTISVTTDDAATCAPAAAPCVVVVQGLTLEQPPTQPMGGGLNATLSAGTITLATPLAYGSSINVHFLHGVRQSGSYRFFFTVDALQ